MLCFQMHVRAHVRARVLVMIWVKVVSDNSKNAQPPEPGHWSNRNPRHSANQMFFASNDNTL